MASPFHYRDAIFCGLLVALVCGLYHNSLEGTFIWDDRAAVTTLLSELLLHDFWGTDISRNDSHKSYRPVTVATFRADHSLYGLHAQGFHMSNTIIYAVGVVCMYLMVRTSLTPIGARIAALLFTCHPVPVEAVTSIVGRADSLCGLFYFCAVLAYYISVRQDRCVLCASFTGLAIACAALATFSKEVGFTAVGMFAVMEVLHQLAKQVKVSEGAKPAHPVTVLLSALWHCVTSLAFLLRISALVALSVAYFALRAHLHGDSMVYKWTLLENHVHHLPGFSERALSYAQYHALYLWKLVYPAQLCFDYGFACVPTVHSWADPLNVRPLLAYSGVVALIYYALRYLRVNLLLGLALLIVPLTPALNIFMPVGALVAERLLFIPSAGFCIIVAELLTVDAAWVTKQLASYSVQQTLSPRNITGADGTNSRRRPTTLKKTVGLAATEAIGQASRTPSKNIVKETETEKRVSFASPGNQINGNGQHGKGKSKSPQPRRQGSKASDTASNGSVSATLTAPQQDRKGTDIGDMKKRRIWGAAWPYLPVIPVLIAYSLRVVSRNADWRDEFSLYSSGLEVCPRSLKVLTNYALLAMARGQVREGLDAALRAVEIYPQQVAALVNAGVAYQKLGMYGESVNMFQRCLRIDPAMAKAAGYLGVSYYHWAEVQSDPTAGLLLRREALRSLQSAVDMGFQAPMILHLTGSTLIELDRREESIAYYEAALQQSANYAAYYQNKGVPILLEDDILPVNTLNQLGSVHWALKNTQQAVDAFIRGLQIAPDNIALLTNLGNVYRDLGQLDEARRLMREGIRVSGEAVPPALYNNLGLLELEVGSFDVARSLFEEALRALAREAAAGAGTANVGVNGAPAEAVIRGNIRRAEEGRSQAAMSSG